MKNKHEQELLRKDVILTKEKIRIDQEWKDKEKINDK